MSDEKDILERFQKLKDVLEDESRIHIDMLERVKVVLQPPIEPTFFDYWKKFKLTLATATILIFCVAGLAGFYFGSDVVLSEENRTKVLLKLVESCSKILPGSN